jgi:pimeloyl-ACP methyl ester carboxylesterase
VRDQDLIDELVKKTPADDTFYTTPDPLPGDSYGEPIYLRPLENTFSAPQGGESWLVLYRSEPAGPSPTRTPVATSGIIVLPDSSKHPVPYPLVSWCHGTVGVANRVAPSRDDGNTGASDMNEYPKTLLTRFLDRGWAVAMTDYEALGTGTDYEAPGKPFPPHKIHPFLLGQSEARAALDIVLAARRLFGDELSERFALVGHSQGGQAALFAAANAPDRGLEDGLVGVAAIAPANHPLGLVRAGAANTDKDPLTDGGGGGYAFTPLFLAGAIGGSIADAAAGENRQWGDAREIDPQQVLSDDAWKLWPQVWEKSRAELSADTSFGGLKGIDQFQGYGGLLKPYFKNPPNYPNDDQKEFERQLAKMNPDLDISVPVRISQAEADQRVKYELPTTVITPELKGTKDLINELKKRNGDDNIDKKIYTKTEVTNDEKPLGAHFTTINADTDELIDWLVKRGIARHR